MELIEQFEADGAEIQRVIYQRLMPSLDGEQLGYSVLALIALSVILMKPDIEGEQLQEIITNVSQTIILHLSEAPSDTKWDA